MVSVWFQRTGDRQPEKLAGHLTEQQAVERMKAEVAKARKEGFTITGDVNCEVFAWAQAGNKKPFIIGNLYIERVPVPSKPDPLDVRRTVE